ncbi:MAG: response regulator, partial [Rhodothermales bacterium]|nr:response regulator [Rhodothermales bacterium]
MPTRILLIEDNLGDAVIFREKLDASDLDYDLVHTARLSEGLETLESGAFDILLVDLSLPDAQGIETVTRVRDAAPNVPLIVLTGLDDATAAAQAKKAGAVDYLVKWYVDSVSLARYIRYAIAQRRLLRDEGASTSRAAKPRQAGPEEATQERQGRERVVVEGQVMRGRATHRNGAAPAAAEPERDAGESDRTEREPLRVALEESGQALAVVTKRGRVAFATPAARAWMGEDEDVYPWAVEEGERRIPRKGQALHQQARPTTWAGESAYLVLLSEAPRPEPMPEAPPPATSAPPPETLRRTAEAALSYVEHTEQRSGWMADVLRSALDLQHVRAEEVEPQPQRVDVLELAQQAVRKHRPVAMRRGIPLRVTSPRDKVVAWADRNAVAHLLRRLVLDAVQACGADGVTVTVRVEGDTSVVEAEWSGEPPGDGTTT